MNAPRFLTVLLATVAFAYAQEKDAPWEEAALNAVRAINSGDADLYLASSHPEEQARLKSKFMEKVLTPTPGITPEAQLKTYGISTVDQLARMPTATFAAIAIQRDYAANDAETREVMARASFRVTGAEKVSDTHYRVTIALHVPFEVQPLDRELIANVVKSEAGWKYNGLK